MKTSYMFIACLLLASACKKTEVIDIVREAEPEKPTAVYTYYSYVAGEIINAEKLGYAGTEFTPGCTCVYGDTLFISNTQPGHFSIELYSRSRHQKIGSLTHWSYQGTEQSFQNYVEALSVSNGRLYAANIGSCIDVFDVATLKFITRIGTRNWGSSQNQLLHAHAMAVAGNYIVVRMKNRLQVYLQSDVSEAGYQQIPFYARGSVDGFDVNNGFYPHQMAVDSTGVIYLADYGQAGNRKIQVIDTALIQKGDNQILTDERTLSLDFHPRGIAFYRHFMYVSASDGSIRFYNRDKKEFFQICRSVSGYTFQGAQKLSVSGDRLWVTDITAKTVVGVDIYRNEIEEYAAASQSSLPLPE